MIETPDTPPLEDFRDLSREMDNFREIARYLRPSPGDEPRLEGLDIAGISMPLHGDIGGDHMLYIDFRHRFDLDARIARAVADDLPGLATLIELNRTRAGILVADVAGHRVTDALICAMLHQAFLVGASYEMDAYGEITTRLFEHINTRFYHSSTINKYLTMLYGEIATSGRFRFINAGHPSPIVFSRRFARIVGIAEERMTRFPPIGIFPSHEDVDRGQLGGTERFKERYAVNEIDLLGSGDLLLLCTDGLLEHGEGRFAAESLERELAGTAHRPAAEIAARLKTALLAFAPPADDISFVVIRRN